MYIKILSAANIFLSAHENKDTSSQANKIKITHMLTTYDKKGTTK